MSDDEAIDTIDDIIPDEIKEEEEELSDLDDTELKTTSGIKNQLSDDENEYSSGNEEIKLDQSSDDDDVDYALTSNMKKDVESGDCYQKYAKDMKSTVIENKKLTVDKE